MSVEEEDVVEHAAENNSSSSRLPEAAVALPVDQDDEDGIL